MTGSELQGGIALGKSAHGDRPETKLRSRQDVCECCADLGSDLDNTLVVTWLAAIAQIREFHQGFSRPYVGDTFPKMEESDGVAEVHHRTGYS